MIPLELVQYKFVERILDDYTLTLHQGKFNDYLRIFKVLVDIDLKENISDSVFEGVRKLFQLRNQFAHGAEIEYEKIENKTLLTPTGKYKGVVDYLNKKNVDMIDGGKLSLMKNEVANHFHKMMVKFILEFNSSIDQSQRTMIQEELEDLLAGNSDYRE